MNVNGNTRSVWAYLGRKFWIALVGAIILTVLLMITHKMEIKTELYEIFAKNLTRLIWGYSMANGAISIGSFAKDLIKNNGK